MKSTTHREPHWLALFLCTLPWLSACTAITTVPEQSAANEGFAIYLLAHEIASAEVLDTPLDALQPEAKPILSLGDIEAYAPDTHTIALTPSGYEKIRRLQVPTSGIPFVVCVNHQPIYAGAFWASYSSQSFDGAVIDTLRAGPGRSFRIQLGYPESHESFTGEDRRSDPRILQSLQQAGKLKNALPTPYKEAWTRTLSLASRQNDR